MLPKFQSLLADEELDRANRFRFEHLRRSYIISRAALRMLLGCYSRTAPKNIHFDYSPNGKPSSNASADICFNASHSKAFTLLAFTRECNIGVDLEEIRPLSDMTAIARQFFCADEAAELLSLPAAERRHAFFLCWTRKEAYLKATGDGLSIGLDRFRVSLRPSEPARFIHFAEEVPSAKRWVLHDLKPVQGYAAAVAYSGTPRTIQVFALSEPTQLLDIGRIG
ncbi:MAG: 4'-phosphopantetheinyl transferase superfamily protein [Acidobacteriaceae bacterium]|nr:4'-phosphopantetheinyl transferase superfamily protein [Acidobacteriaceae bacterium]